MTSTLTDRLDGLSSSAAIKGPCRVATTGNITLSGPNTIDGVQIVPGDRVLVKDQTAGVENGIWIVDTGPWRRSRDFNKTRDVVKGTQVLVTSGSFGDRWFGVAASDAIAVGVSAISFLLSDDVAAAEAAALAAQAAAAGVILPSAVPSTYLKQKADGTGYETRAAVQTADDLNQAAVQIFGDSASRSARARFGDTFDVKEFGFDVTGAAGTEAAKNDALDRLIAHAKANPGMVYRGGKGDVHAVECGEKHSEVQTTT